MSQDAFKRITNDNCRLIFPTYHSFLGSLGLLLSESVIEYQMDKEQEEGVETKPPQRRAMAINIKEI